MDITIVSYNCTNMDDIKKQLPHLRIRYSGGTNELMVSDSKENSELVECGMSIISVPMLFGHFAWGVSKIHVFKGEI